MGIQGLLGALEETHGRNDVKCGNNHVSELRNQVAVVDGNSWLHKALYGCAKDICLGIPTRKYVAYISRRLNLLRENGVHAVVVFDGSPLPAKANTHENRRKTRDQALERGKALHDQGDGEGSLLWFQRGYSVSTDVIHVTMNAIRAQGFESFIAPYEADPQMVYLVKRGRAQCIITEDSDLIVFCVAMNVRCSIVTKMDGQGNCRIFHACPPSDMHVMVTNPNRFVRRLKTFDGRMFVQMCILSGCDYIRSIKGIGLKTAQDLVLRFHRLDSDRRIERIVKALRSENKTQVPERYVQEFRNAEMLFYHQLVFDPMENRLVHAVRLDQAGLGFGRGCFVSLRCFEEGLRECRDIGCLCFLGYSKVLLKPGTGNESSLKSFKGCHVEVHRQKIDKENFPNKRTGKDSKAVSMPLKRAKKSIHDYFSR